jgi:uncharacterized Zn finger protein
VATDTAPARPAAAGVHAATLYCEVCGEETPHRIVHLDRATGRAVSGVARCRTCRTTHPFSQAAAERASVFVIRSEGRSSVRSLEQIAANARLEVGERLPGVEPALLIHKLDRDDGRSVRSADARRVRTAWVTADDVAVLKVSMVVGRRTASSQLVVPPEAVLHVGDPVTIEGREWYVVALRANGRTWRHPEDAFPARSVQRVYTRRYASPPEGSSGWSRSREMPMSRASSTSRSARSRSGPGVRT